MNAKIIRAAAIAVFSLGAVAVPAADKAAEPATPISDMVIYDTALAPGWENWSWAKTVLSNELAGSPRKPIKVESGPWTALYLHHAPFTTTGYKKISFLIQGTSPDAEVKLFALVDGKLIGEGRAVKFKNTGWTKVEVPLVTLGVEEQAIDGFWLQNTSAVDLPKYFVTEIKLQ
jgi:hypothetical protein